jgi:hypothetical protein
LTAMSSVAMSSAASFTSTNALPDPRQPHRSCRQWHEHL